MGLLSVAGLGPAGTTAAAISPQLPWLSFSGQGDQTSSGTRVGQGYYERSGTSQRPHSWALGRPHHCHLAVSDSGLQSGCRPAQKLPPHVSAVTSSRDTICLVVGHHWHKTPTGQESWARLIGHGPVNRGFWSAVTLMGSRGPGRVACVEGRPPLILLGGCWTGRRTCDQAIRHLQCFSLGASSCNSGSRHEVAVRGISVGCRRSSRPLGLACTGLCGAAPCPEHTATPTPRLSRCACPSVPVSSVFASRGGRKRGGHPSSWHCPGLSTGRWPACLHVCACA